MWTTALAAACPPAPLRSLLLTTALVLVELGLAEQWILWCSYIISEPASPRVAHWHLSHRGADERGRRSPPFFLANFNTFQKPPLGASPLAPLWTTISSLYAGEEIQIGARLHRDASTDGGVSPLSRWASSTQDPVFLLCPVHPINTGTPLTCTYTHLRPLFSIFLHLCLSLTLGPVNAGSQQSCTSVRYQKGNGVQCFTPTLSL